MVDNVELMTASLSSYLPDPPNIQTYQELVEFFSNRITYHTQPLPREVIRSAFTKTFNKDHFRYQKNEDTSGKKRYGLTLIPKEALHTCNKDVLASTNKYLKLFRYLLEKEGAFNKVKNYFNVDRINSIQIKAKLGLVEMILKLFKVAWDLQGDGDQTNAPLCPASTKKLTDHLIKANIL